MQKITTTGETIQVQMKTGRVLLDGTLSLPPNAQGVVLFAHGSGSSRLSPRNVYVATELLEAGIGALLFDLLTREEEKIDDMTGELRFDIDLLTKRLIAATDWVKQDPAINKLKIGYFGASTGAAAALAAAAQRPDVVSAVVSRGGRPDLAGDALPEVKAPTLLIVGGSDHQVIELNKRAEGALKSEKKLVIVPRATHLFEEPGTLEEVARLAVEWFKKYLG